jgi:hypothetical protein
MRTIFIFFVLVIFEVSQELLAFSSAESGKFRHKRRASGYADKAKQGFFDG